MAGQDPGQLGHLGHVRLHPEMRIFRVEPQRQEIDRGSIVFFLTVPGSWSAGHGVVVDDEAEELVLLLEFDHALHHREIIADMERALTAVCRRVSVPWYNPSVLCASVADLVDGLGGVILFFQFQCYRIVL